MIGNDWSPLRVLFRTLVGAQGVATRVWLARYFFGRGTEGKCPAAVVGAVAPRSPQLLRFSRAPTPLVGNPDLGGLSAWYEIGVQRVYAPLPELGDRQPWFVVDVGANIGAFSQWVISELGGSGQLLSIEPNPKAFAALEQALRPGLVDVECLNIALGNEDGSLLLRWERGRAVEGTVVAPREMSGCVGISGSPRVNEIRVPVKRLDALLEERSVVRVDLLKIDVEGYEIEMLRGAPRTLTQCRHVVVETQAATLGGVRTLVERAGLHLCAFRNGIWGDERLGVAHFSRA